MAFNPFCEIALKSFRIFWNYFCCGPHARLSLFKPRRCSRNSCLTLDMNRLSYDGGYFRERIRYYWRIVSISFKVFSLFLEIFSVMKKLCKKLKKWWFLLWPGSQIRVSFVGIRIRAIAPDPVPWPFDSGSFVVMNGFELGQTSQGFSLMFCRIRNSRSYLIGTPKSFRFDPRFVSGPEFHFKNKPETGSSVRSDLKRCGLTAALNRSLKEWSIERARCVTPITHRAALFTRTEREVP